MKIGIIGLGLIGGSLAKAIKHYTKHTVLAKDIAETVVAKAKQVQAIDDELQFEQMQECDIIIIALYPNATISFLRGNAKLLRGTTVIDCCGVKRVVQETALPIAKENGFVFIGGHPMAGTECSGFTASTANLFANASMILTPDVNVDVKLLSEVESFFLSLGFGRIQISTPDAHDRIISYTSQLAHVLSSAYVKSETAMLHSGFSAGSFLDMTRVALLNEDMWTELFLANSDNLANEAQALAERLLQYAQAIRSHDAQTLKTLLTDGRERKAFLMTRDGQA